MVAPDSSTLMELSENSTVQPLGAEEVSSIIRDTNQASQRVALRNGMKPVDTWTKHYRGVDMPHIRYAVRKENAEDDGSTEAACMCMNSAML